MHDAALRDHLTIVTLLPDYVLGALDETTERRVARHLDDCAICRDEYANALDVLGTLSDVPPPPAAARDAVLGRLDEQRSSPGHPDCGDEGAVSPASAFTLFDLPFAALERRLSARLRRTAPRWALLAASVAAFLISGALDVNPGQHAAEMSADGVFSTTEDPTAFPLDDSDLSDEAAGVLFAEPRGREVLLVANGLPELPQDQRYQVWLFTTDDEQVSAGLISAGSDGEVRALLQTPDPFASYVGVGLTAEPQSGSFAPTSGLVLGGSFPPMPAPDPSRSV